MGVVSHLIIFTSLLTNSGVPHHHHKEVNDETNMEDEEYVADYGHDKEYYNEETRCHDLEDEQEYQEHVQGC